jgi:hypothetical protein
MAGALEYYLATLVDPNSSLSCLQLQLERDSSDTITNNEFA